MMSEVRNGWGLAFFSLGLIWSSKRALLRIGQINVPRVCMKSGASFNTRSLFSPHFHP